MQSRNAPSLVLSFIVIGLCLMQGLSVRAQDRSNNPLPNTVWVAADGKHEADPDTVLVQLNISAQDEKLQNANDRATRAADQIRQLLQSKGLDPKQAQIGRFAVQPVYDDQNPKRKLLGYRVESDISIKFSDFSKVGPITQGLAEIDVTANQQLSYILEDTDAAKIKAVQDALRRARDEANAVAMSSGRTLGDLSYASVDTYEPGPRPMAMAMKAAGPAAGVLPAPTEEFAAQKVTVTAHVNALYSLK
jgi:uncharacterized protein YggE